MGKTGDVSNRSNLTLQTYYTCNFNTAKLLAHTYMLYLLKSFIYNLFLVLGRRVLPATGGVSISMLAIDIMLHPA